MIKRGQTKLTKPYRELTREKSMNPRWRDKLRNICFCDDESYPPLQVADALAWLTRHFVMEEKRPINHLSLSDGEIKRLVDLATVGLNRGSLIYGGEALSSVDEGIKRGKDIEELYPVIWYKEGENGKGKNGKN